MSLNTGMRLLVFPVVPCVPVCLVANAISLIMHSDFRDVSFLALRLSAIAAILAPLAWLIFESQ